MSRSIRLLALALLFSACASAGTNFRWANLRQVQLGMTKAEVVRLMGRPYMVQSVSGTSAIASGGAPVQVPMAAAPPVASEPRELWIWSYAYVGPTFQPQTKSATIGFQGGRVISVPSVPDEFQDEASGDSAGGRVTP